MPITLVLPIVGLDIVNISSGNSGVLRLRAGRTKRNLSSYYLSLAKSQAAVPADEFQIPNHRHALFVSGNAMPDIRNKYGH